MIRRHSVISVFLLLLLALLGWVWHERVNLQAFQHMTPEHKLPDSWFRMLDWVVANATEAHLQVILDEHDFIYCGETNYV